MRLYLLPNLLTTGNLFFGFYSIVSTIRGAYEHAVWAVFLSMLMDILDGRVARLTRTTSDFGVNYDSFADLVSFGVAPSLLVYKWLLYPFGRVGWLIAFLFVACGALRLARFNVMVASSKEKDFMGLPIPAAAGLVSSYYLIASERLAFLPGKFIAFVGAFLMVASSLLMVSRLRYMALKGGLSLRASFAAIFSFVLVLFIIASDPYLFIFVAFFFYFLSGPFLCLNRTFDSAEEVERGSHGI